jgi:hypothetical protein
LLTVSAELKRRGCIILGMAVTCVSSYRLTLSWPRPQQAEILPRHASPQPAGQAATHRLRC